MGIRTTNWPYPPGTLKSMRALIIIALLLTTGAALADWERWTCGNGKLVIEIYETAPGVEVAGVHFKANDRSMMCSPGWRGPRRAFDCEADTEIFIDNDGDALVYDFTGAKEGEERQPVAVIYGCKKEIVAEKDTADDDAIDDVVPPQSQELGIER